MVHRSGLGKRVSSILLAGFLLFAWGCSEGPVPGAMSPSAPNKEQSLAKEKHGKRVKRKAKRYHGTESASIVALEGGRLKNGPHKMDVPPKALKYDTQMYIAVQDNDYIEVDFGPDGWFEAPIKITMSYEEGDLDGSDPSTLALNWYDESTGEWVKVGGVVDQRRKTVTADVWHFTQYTLSVD